MGKILVLVCEVKISFRLEDNAEMDLKEIWCEDVGTGSI